MKKLVVLFLLIHFASKAQEINYGIKGGGIYQDRAKSFISKREIGYHHKNRNPFYNLGWQGGGFLNFKFPSFLLRNEILYNHLQNSFPFVKDSFVRSSTHSLDFSIMPALVIKKFMYLYGGPIFSFNMKSTLELESIENYILHKFDLIGQIGITFYINHLSIDLGGEFPLSNFKSSFNYLKKNYFLRNRTFALKASISYFFIDFY